MRGHSDESPSRPPARDSAEGLDVEQIKRTIEAINSALSTHAPEVARAFKTLDSSLSAASPDAYRLGKRGWTIPMWADVGNLGPLLQSILANDADAWFERHYLKNRARAMKDTSAELARSPGLQRWQPMLAEIDQSLRDQRYFVALPGLFAVFEGSLLAASELALRGIKAASANRDRYAASGIDKLSWASLHGFVATTFMSIPLTDSPRTDANRHVLMHGRALPALPQRDCLKLLNALATVSYELPSRSAV